MIKKIGLMDYDVLCTSRYVAPNYHLGITYSHLSQDPNLSVHLITTIDEKNLENYDTIFIFKLSPFLPHPSVYIKNYYKYPIQEFGSGFINREDRPEQIKTSIIKPDFSCYNPILQFSSDRPKDKRAWYLKNAYPSRNRDHLLLYDKIGGEYLRKDMPAKCNNLNIYDNPLTLFNNKNYFKTITDLIKEGYKLYFTQPIDISFLKDTNIIELLSSEKNFATLRNHCIISILNDSATAFINYYLNHKCKNTKVQVLLPKGKTKQYYFQTLLWFNYINNQTGYLLRLKPSKMEAFSEQDALVSILYKFLHERPFLMSFYEYLFYVEYRVRGVPVKLLKTDEQSYDYVLKKYGMTNNLKKLENWLTHNPEYEEMVFIGGTSNYREIRKKAYDAYNNHYSFQVKE